MKTVVALLFLCTVCFCDIRIQNNDLNAEGHWTLTVKTNQTQQVNDSNQLKQDSVQKDVDTQTKQQNQNQSQQDDEDIIQEYTDASVFEQFTNIQGSCFLLFYDSNLRDTLQNTQKVDSLSIRFHDPKYIDQKIIVLKISLQDYIQLQDDWQNGETKVNFTYYEEFEQMMHGSMNASYIITKENVKFTFSKYELSVNYKKKQHSLVTPILITILSFITLYLAIRFQKRSIPVQKVSIITLYHTIFFFIYMSTFFIIIGMAALPHPTSILLLCGCIQILVAVKLIRKFQTIIQRIANIDGYCMFYCGIFIYVWCLFNYFYSATFILINSLFLVPQIIHSIRVGSKLGKEYEYLAILASPQLYFLYLKGYPDNIFRYHPQPFVCVAIVLIVSLQIWIIYKQSTLGPYFMIPHFLLPDYYQYYKTFKIDSKCDLHDRECAICLCSLTQQGPIHESGQSMKKTEDQLQPQHQKQFNNVNEVRQVTIMVTPCGHQFHSVCLEMWFDFKRQCPVDRSKLPILYK